MIFREKFGSLVRKMDFYLTTIVYGGQGLPIVFFNDNN